MLLNLASRAGGSHVLSASSRLLRHHQVLRAFATSASAAAAGRTNGQSAHPEGTVVDAGRATEPASRAVAAPSPVDGPTTAQTSAIPGATHSAGDKMVMLYTCNVCEVRSARVITKVHGAPHAVQQRADWTAEWS